MNFLNPLFFFGALASAVPILLHLVKRERARRIEFPTLMFLRRISKKSIRFQKLRHLLLLLMRVLAVLLLVLGFTRPFRDLPNVAAAIGRPTQAHIILLDNSLSMGYGDRWERAKKAAVSIARRADQGDKLALLEFSDQTTAKTQLTVDIGQVVSEIETGLELTDRPTRFGQALKIAEKIALDAGTGKRVIHLISDFQKSGWSAGEEDFRLGSGMQLEYVDVGSDDFSNLTFGDVRVDEAGEGTGGGLDIKAAVVNFGTQDRTGVSVSLALDGRVVSEKKINVAKNGLSAAEFQLPGLTPGLHAFVLAVDDRQLDRDNRFSMVVEARGRTPVACVNGPATGRSSHSADFFLGNALNLSSVSPYLLTPIPLQKIESSAAIPGGLVIWNSASGGGVALQKKLQEFVKHGGGLVIVLADSSLAADFNRSFGSWLPVKVLESEKNSRGKSVRPAEDYSLMTDIRQDHPIFRPFSEPHSGSFSTARFYEHARLSATSGAEVLARFDDRTPALVQANIEKGRVLIFPSSADDSTNDLPLKSVYAPFWQQLLRYAANFQEGRRWVEVGDMIAPRRLLVDAALRLGKGNIDLDQSIVVLDAHKSRVPWAASSDALLVEWAGFYEIRTANLNTTVAVNPVPRESDLTHGNPEEMVAGWLSPDANAPRVISEDERLVPEDLERNQRIWRFMLLAAMVFLVAEGVLSSQAVVKKE
jgi:hypothetical protein